MILLTPKRWMEWNQSRNENPEVKVEHFTPDRYLTSFPLIRDMKEVI